MNDSKSHEVAARGTARCEQAHYSDVEAVYRKIAWRLIPILILCYFCAYLDRSNVGIAKLQFDSAIGLTEAMYGLGAGLFYLGYSLLEIPSNMMLARIGARRTFLRIMVLWSLFSAALAFVARPSEFYLLRFVIGAAEAGFFPGVLLFLTQWVPAAQRARFTAFFMSAMALSGVIGGPLSALILHGMRGVAGLDGWQWLFLIEGLPGVALAIVVFLCLPDRPAQASWLTQGEKQIVHSELEAEAHSKKSVAHGSLRAALKDAKFYVLASMSAALISGVGALALWIPTILRDAGVKALTTIAMLSAVPYVFALVIQQFVARRSDVRQERRAHVAVCAALAAIGWLLVPLTAGHPWLTLMVLTIVAAGTFGATGPFWSMPAAYLSGSGAAAGIAAITTCGGIAGFVSPIIAGWLATQAGSTLFATAYYGGLMLLAGILVWFGTKPGSVSANAAH